jgi:hypothetical protein
MVEVRSMVSQTRAQQKMRRERAREILLKNPTMVFGDMRERIEIGKDAFWAVKREVLAELAAMAKKKAT